MSVASDQALGFKPGEELARGVGFEARSPAARHGTAVASGCNRHDEASGAMAACRCVALFRMREHVPDVAGAEPARALGDWKHGTAGREGWLTGIWLTGNPGRAGL